MADLSFQNRLQLHGSALSKSEQKISCYIAAHPDTAATASSQELAQAIGTSGATLTRFFQKLGYRNFIEFQTLLAGEGTPTAAPDGILPKLRHYYERTLHAALALTDNAQIDAFTRKIHDAERILVFGLGSSGLTANEFHMRLVQMGFTSSAMTDSFLMRVQSSLFSPKDLIIVVSNSGDTPEVVSACEIAKSVGAQIAALTRNMRGRIAQLADTILLAGDVRQNGDERFIDEQLPLLFLIDAITYRLLEDPVCREQRTRALQALFRR